MSHHRSETYDLRLAAGNNTNKNNNGASKIAFGKYKTHGTVVNFLASYHFSFVTVGVCVCV